MTHVHAITGSVDTTSLAHTHPVDIESSIPHLVSTGNNVYLAVGGAVYHDHQVTGNTSNWSIANLHGHTDTFAISAGGNDAVAIGGSVASGGNDAVSIAGTSAAGSAHNHSISGSVSSESAHTHSYNQSDSAEATHTHAVDITSFLSGVANDTENRPVFLGCMYIVRVKEV